MSAATGLYATSVRHVRTEPLSHAFEHRSHWWVADVDAPPGVPRGVRWLARLQGRDHLGTDGSLRSRVETFLTSQDVTPPGGPITMACHARSVGAPFNPLTVFWCADLHGEVQRVVMEVCNTYGERHCYLLAPDERGRAEVDKHFYVSPFNDVSGSYTTSLPHPGDDLDLVVTLHREGRAPFVTGVRGRRVRVTRRSTVAAALSTLLTPLRIRTHGVRLWARRLPVQPRPPHAAQEGA